MGPAKKKSNQRQERRFKVDQPVTLTILGSPEIRLPARIENLSRSGMRLKLDRPVPYGAATKIEWASQMALGSVRYCVEEGSGLRVGIQLFSSWESLTEEVLAREADDLARTNQELHQFAHAVSHDLTEQLKLITSQLSELKLRQEAKPETGAETHIRQAVEAARRMQHLLGALVTYSMVNRGGMERRPTHCESALAAAADNLGGEIEESGARLTHDPLPVVLAHPAQITQLFQTLVGNAIQFRGRARLHVHVSAEQRDGEWVFSFRDNGAGIEPRLRERITQMFEHQPAEPDGSVFRLGLPTCRTIVDRHGGRIWVESEVGRGSAFYFSIPAEAWEP